MTWIKNRIDSEYKKHKKLDWSSLAEVKIINTLDYILDEWAKKKEGIYAWQEGIYNISLDDIKELKEKLELKSSLSKREQ